MIALSYARIASQNHVNFGIVTLEFIPIEDYDKIVQGDTVSFKNLRNDIKDRNPIKVKVSNDSGKLLEFETKHTLSHRQISMLLKGGVINEFKEKLNA